MPGLRSRRPLSPETSPGPRTSLGPTASRGPRVRPDTSALLLATVAVAVIWAAVPMALLAYHTISSGGVLSGSDGPLAGADQLFYMDSIRQSGSHLLIGDHFAFSLGQGVFLHPLYLFGGVIWRVGLPLPAVLWFLELLAAMVLAIGTVVMTVRVLAGARARLTAVVLGLFYLTPLLPLLAWTGLIGALPRYQLLLVAGETMPAWQLWGYPHTAITVGALAGAFAGAAALGAGKRSVGLIVAVSAGACICGWLHPWQGAIFILVVAALALQTRSRAVASRLAIPVIAAAAPMLYEAILSRTDAAWKVDSLQNGVGQGPLWALALGLLPLAVPAAIGVRRMAPGPLRTVLVGWPLAAVIVYYATAQFPYHALDGISIPLALLAVAAWCGGRDPARGQAGAIPAGRARLRTGLVLAAVAVAVVPGAIYELRTFRDSERSGAAPYFIGNDDHAALRYLEHASGPGGVLARDYIAMAVPAFTGRPTWVGEWTWTPQFAVRAALAEQLMRGTLDPVKARQLVRGTGARFVLRDCGAGVRLGALLGPLVAAEHRFGCAAVYELRPLNRA
jgi:hypothetical protein